MAATARPHRRATIAFGIVAAVLFVAAVVMAFVVLAPTAPTQPVRDTADRAAAVHGLAVAIASADDAAANARAHGHDAYAARIDRKIYACQARPSATTEQLRACQRDLIALVVDAPV